MENMTEYIWSLLSQLRKQRGYMRTLENSMVGEGAVKGMHCHLGITASPILREGFHRGEDLSWVLKDL